MPLQMLNELPCEDIGLCAHPPSHWLHHEDKLDDDEHEPDPIWKILF